jgi:hypothetical protein
MAVARVVRDVVDHHPDAALVRPCQERVEVGE